MHFNKKNIVAVALVLTATIALTFAYNKFNNKEYAFEGQVAQIVEMDKEEQQRNLNQIVEENQINIQYAAGVVFEGKTSKNFSVKNIQNNNGDIKFTIYDKDGDVIYESDAIQRGYECTQITLDKELPKGTNECKISIGYVEAGNVKNTFPLTIEVI